MLSLLGRQMSFHTVEGKVPCHPFKEHCWSPYRCFQIVVGRTEVAKTTHMLLNTNAVCSVICISRALETHFGEVTDEGKVTYVGFEHFMEEGKASDVDDVVAEIPNGPGRMRCHRHLDFSLRYGQIRL